MGDARLPWREARNTARRWHALMVQDEVPVPKVIDFGVAKATLHRLTERTLFTEQGQLIGTPGYMSPEQAEMTALDIDTRTDVYSLGVLLYELLVGALPFDAERLLLAGFGEMQRIIREVDPPNPSTRLSALQSEPNSPAPILASPLAKGERRVSNELDSKQPSIRSIEQIAHSRHTEPKTLIRQIRGDIDWIVMKCLEKDRTRRYDTANALAMEIARYLSNEPVLACAPSVIYRFRKFVERNRVIVAAVSTVIIALIVGLGAVTTMYARSLEDRTQLRAADAVLRATLAQAEKTRNAERRITAILTDAISAMAKQPGKDSVAREILYRAAAEAGNNPDTRAALLWRFRDILAWMENEANGLENQAQYVAAGEVYRDIMEIYRHMLGAEHPQTFSSMERLCTNLVHQRRLTEAEILWREILRLRRRVMGEEHSTVNATVVELASFLTTVGKHKEAESLVREHHAILEHWPSRAVTDSDLSQNKLLIPALQRIDEYNAIKELSDVSLCAKTDKLHEIVEAFDLLNQWEPGKGFAEKAAEWRSKLDALNAETQKSQAPGIDGSTP